jgi:hypothetical protein
LLYSRIVIEPPEEFIPANAATPQPLRWLLTGYSDAMLEQLWNKAGLSPAQRATLAAHTRRDPSSGQAIVSPDPELVLGLTPPARATIYAALAAFPENRAQNDPFRIRADALEEWFDETVLPADIMALTRRLIFERNGIAMFADSDLVLPKLSPDDRPKFIKNIARKSTLLVQLEVPHGADVEALTRYWGRGGRAKDVRSLVSSLAQRANGGAIDIVHFLPSFPRSLLYTFPSPSLKASDAAHDCHWTSLNFFNAQPDERFADTAFVQQTVVDDFYPAAGAPEFGDMIMLQDPANRIIHSCIYIADDIVFTKNGPAFSTPWQFSRLDGVIAFYSFGEPLQPRRYRRRDR